MIKYAIVGNIASGKSTVEEILRNNGYKVFDTDKIAHEILNNSNEIREIFKSYDIITDNKIDRKKLAKIVFSDKNQLKKLEAVIHPKVKEEILKIFNMNFDIVFISVPQLFEAGFENLFDKIIFITAQKDIRLKRLIKRNNCSAEEGLQRIESQIPDENKLQKCDLVIENNDSVDNLKNLVNKIFPSNR